MASGQSVLLLNHSEAESVDAEARSHSNQHEAKFLTQLCKYFLLQGYKPSQITIMTLYTGQLFEFKKLMPKNQFEGVRVTTVDNYQVRILETAKFRSFWGLLL